VLGVPYVNRQDLLHRAIDSLQPLWAQPTIIIDNSVDGLPQAEYPVLILRPPVPLSVSQTQNWLVRRALEGGDVAYATMHTDAAALPGTPEKLAMLIDALCQEGRRWGSIMTNEDALVVFSAGMLQEVGLWDTVLPQYFADTDFYRRIALAGYERVESGLPVLHEVSATIKSDPWLMFLNHQTFPLYEQYFAAKWGGKKGQESFVRPFNGAGVGMP
jgi:hypothetical protein